MKTILFDLDGTLTDPKEGIVRCFQYALEKINGPRMEAADLIPHIGPPIRDSLSLMLDTDDRVTIDQALSYYRERYADVGMFENRVYEGIRDVLAGLADEGHRLFVATSKAQIYARKIIDFYQLAPYFIKVYGSKLDGTLSDKDCLLAHILAAEQPNREETLMIGDRKYDIAAAVVNRIMPVGVLWGYGSLMELRSAGASCFCNKPGQLLALTA